MTAPIDFEATLRRLAFALADDVIHAELDASLAELVADALMRAPLIASKPITSLPDTAPGEILTDILDRLRNTPAGLRAEHLRRQTRLEKGAFKRALREGLTSGALRKTGQKRATVYFATLG